MENVKTNISSESEVDIKSMFFSISSILDNLTLDTLKRIGVFH